MDVDLVNTSVTVTEQLRFVIAYLHDRATSNDPDPEPRMATSAEVVAWIEGELTASARNATDHYHILQNGRLNP